MPSDWRYGATVVSNRAMLSSSSTQLSAADISVRENSRVTKGPAGAALRAEAGLAGSACKGAPAALAVATSATAAATVTALSRAARPLPACFLSRSPVTMVTSEVRSGCRSGWLRCGITLPRGATLKRDCSSRCAQRRGLGRQELDRATVWDLAVEDEEASEAVPGVVDGIGAITTADG